jgi:hypothetical protein
VTVTSNGGNITATGISDATLQTGGGNLTVDGLTGNVSLNTDSTPNGPYGGGGQVDGTLAAQNVAVDTGGNSVDLQLTAAPSNLNVTTEGGDVTLQLPAGYSYRVDDIKEPPSQVQMTGPAPPPAITVTTSTSSQYRITVNADGGAVTID